MPLTFPSSPTPGQQTTTGGRTYSWNGQAWDLVGTAVAGPTGPSGAASTVTGPTGAASTVTGPTGPAGAFDQDLNTTDSVSFQTVLIDASVADPALAVIARDPSDDSVLDVAYIGVRSSVASAFVQSQNGWLRVEKNGGDIGGLVVETVRFVDETEQTTAWTGSLSYTDLDDLPTLGTAAAAASTDFAAANHTHAQLHDRSHAITSTSDHTATAWRVFHSNGSGQVVELALGSAGQALISNGASATPSWGAAGSNSASDLTTGTLNNARLTARARAAVNVFNWSSFR